MKRKPPKNLRPYATPSGKKARMVQISALDVGMMSGIDSPHVYSNRVGSVIQFWANAADVAKWRASQTTSGADQ